MAVGFLLRKLLFVVGKRKSKQLGRRYSLERFLDVVDSFILDGQQIAHKRANVAGR